MKSNAEIQRGKAKELWIIWIGFLTFVEMNLTVLFTSGLMKLFYFECFMIMLAPITCYLFRFWATCDWAFGMFYSLYLMAFSLMTSVLLCELFVSASEEYFHQIFFVVPILTLGSGFLTFVSWNVFKDFDVMKVRH